MGESNRWAREEFGHADLGDVRRRDRLLLIAASAHERPDGKVAAVFGSDREREAAYDFLESEHVECSEIMDSVRKATLRRCAAEPFVFVPVDGTSISLTDTTGERQLGRIGSDASGGRGLKVVDALAVDREGTVVGWLDLRFWARSLQRNTPPRHTHARQARPVAEKETQRWIDTVTTAAAALDEAGLLGWFQIDREGDGRDLLCALQATHHHWTVRGRSDRNIELEGGDIGKLRAWLGVQATIGKYELALTARAGKRSARTAQIVVRVATAVLRLRDKHTDRITTMPVTAVLAREEGTTPDGEDPVDWLLYTNRNVETLDDAWLVVFGYAQRWRIEECHRTWKAGACNVESTQLRSAAAIERWAIILAAVAARIERLKRLARANGDRPATIELDAFEIRALRMLHFRGREAQARDPASISEAVAWIAELGGFANKYSDDYLARP